MMPATVPTADTMNVYIDENLAARPTPATLTLPS